MAKNNMRAYKIFRTILTPIYKLWYNPKIIGKENIPKEGSILVVGNHVHIMDQCNVVGETKRCLHYMAKKEYFDNKKVRWFFESSGCIPVDRSIHDESAKSAAMEVLEGGHALGLFPEGTRNGLKEERIKKLYKKYLIDCIEYKEFVQKVKHNKTSQIDYLEELIEQGVIKEQDFIKNIYDTDSYLKKLIKSKKITKDDYYNHILLPFKFGAVSMAKKTDSYLVPYAITGTYKFRSKDLTIRIGEPFKVGKDENLEDANKRLRDTIIDLYRKNCEK